MVHIPTDRKYFRIGETSKIVGVEPSVLRYWEKEFPQIRPQRADSRQRTYQKKDLEILLEIKRLLYEEKMTIKGAKRRLQQKRSKKDDVTSFIEEIRIGLREVLDLLS